MEFLYGNLFRFAYGKYGFIGTERTLFLYKSEFGWF